MRIPTIEEVARRLDLKRQKKESAKGGSGGLTYIDEEEINSLHTLAQLSELESVKEGTRQVVGEMTEAQNKMRKILLDRSRK